jgi:hypothetical protein
LKAFDAAKRNQQKGKQMAQRKETRATKETKKKEGKIRDLKPKKDLKGGTAVGGGGGTRIGGGGGLP